MKKSNLILLFLLPLFLGAQDIIEDNATLDLLRTEIMKKKKIKTADQDLSELVISSQNTSRRSGVVNTYVKQYYKGIEIYNALSNISVMPTGKVLIFHDKFSYKLAETVNTTSAELTAKQAVENTAKEIGYKRTSKLKVVEDHEKLNQSQILSNSGISEKDIPARLVYYKTEKGALVLAWNFTIYEVGGENWWNYRVDAQTGAILDKDNMMSN